MKQFVAVSIAVLLAAVFVPCVGLACHKEVDHPTLDYYRYSGGVGLPGDINMDGRVDLADLEILNRGFGIHLGDPDFNACADLNANGVIDPADRAILD